MPQIIAARVTISGHDDRRALLPVNRLEDGTMDNW